jgi:putative phosphoesterase
MTRRVRDIGVISDTHGLLRPEAVAALRGVHTIIHAGDVGTADVLEGLAELAPVIAVRGNNDQGPWAAKLPLTTALDIDGARLYVLHDLKALALDPRTAGVAAVISGHSHQPRAEDRGGVLFFNPGSAGPRRFRLPVTVGRLRIARGRVSAQLIPLACPPGGAPRFPRSRDADRAAE